MPRRILFVNTPTYIGGSEISLLALMEHLSAEYYLPFLLTSGDGELIRRSREIGVPSLIQEFPWLSRRRPWRYIFSIYKLIRTIRNNKIDLIHTNCDHSLRYIMQTSKVTRTPYVSHVRDFVRTWFQPDKVIALNRAARVIANSDATAEACMQAGIKFDRTVTIYNPVDIEKFLKTPSTAKFDLRVEFNIPPNTLVVGIVGQIQPIKGQREFVDAGFQLAKEFPDIHFLIVGSVAPISSGKSYFGELKNQIMNNEYADRFHFSDFRYDISSVMKVIDILAVPSYIEAFGRVAVEGMAAGCAVVGTNVGGLPEIISNEIDGLLVSPRDADALFAAIKRLVVDTRLRQQLIRSGRSSIQKFSIRNHVDQMQILYDNVLSAH